jgi:hypothetical protein
MLSFCCLSDHRLRHLLPPTQPMFVTLEAALVSAVPALDRWAGAGGYAGNARELVVRFTMRWAYVGVITVIALYFPNFGAVLALIGVHSCSRTVRSCDNHGCSKQLLTY